MKTNPKEIEVIDPEIVNPNELTIKK